jgi:hypothetical protein
MSADNRTPAPFVEGERVDVDGVVGPAGWPVVAGRVIVRFRMNDNTTTALPLPLAAVHRAAPDPAPIPAEREAEAVRAEALAETLDALDDRFWPRREGEHFEGRNERHSEWLYENQDAIAAALRSHAVELRQPVQRTPASGDDAADAMRFMYSLRAAVRQHYRRQVSREPNSDEIARTFTNGLSAGEVIQYVYDAVVTYGAEKDKHIADLIASVNDQKADAIEWREKLDAAEAENARLREQVARAVMFAPTHFAPLLEVVRDAKNRKPGSHRAALLREIEYRIEVADSVQRAARRAR